MKFNTIKKMSSNLDHKSNLITTLAIAVGTLSLIEQISIILGIIVLIMAGVSNYFSIRKNKQAYENEKLKSQRLNPNQKNKPLTK